MFDDRRAIPESRIINEIQLILAEKRTSLATMRTGIAVFVLPLSVLSILVATSGHYDFNRMLPLLIPIFVLCGGLVVLGVYLVHRAVLKIRKFDRMVTNLKQQDPNVEAIVD